MNESHPRVKRNRLACASRICSIQVGGLIRYRKTTLTRRWRMILRPRKRNLWSMIHWRGFQRNHRKLLWRETQRRRWLRGNGTGWTCPTPYRCRTPLGLRLLTMGPHMITIWRWLKSVIWFGLFLTDTALSMIRSMSSKLFVFGTSWGRVSIHSSSIVSSHTCLDPRRSTNFPHSSARNISFSVIHSTTFNFHRW